MRNMTAILAAALLLCGNSAAASEAKVGKAAKAGSCAVSDGFAWGIGLGALVVIGIVVGVTVAGSTK